MAWIASLFSSLASSTPFWEGIEYSAEAIVVIGAVGEFLTEFEYTLKGDDKKVLRHRIGKLAAIVLIVGLAIELGALVRTNQLSSKTLVALYQQASQAGADAVTARNEAIQSDGRAQTAFKAATEAQDRADTAERQAGSAIKQAAVNAKEAARLNKLAQDEALARVKIEERLAPRRITAEQTTKLSNELEPLKGKNVGLFVLTGDPETSSFGSALESVLKAAGLNVKVSPGIVFGEVQAGISIMVGKNRMTEAAILAKALIDANLAPGPIPAGTSTDAEFLQITVGPK
jgi:hypothetical protein